MLGSEKARKTGETARVGAGIAGASPWRARGAEPISIPAKEEMGWCKPCPGEKGSRRSVSIAPTRNAAGRGTDCSRETG